MCVCACVWGGVMFCFGLCPFEGKNAAPLRLNSACRNKGAYKLPAAGASSVKICPAAVWWKLRDWSCVYVCFQWFLLGMHDWMFSLYDNQHLPASHNRTNKGFKDSYFRAWGHENHFCCLSSTFCIVFHFGVLVKIFQLLSDDLLHC